MRQKHRWSAWRAMALGLAASLLAPSAAVLADDAKFSAALGQAASRVMTARTIKALCDERGLGDEMARRDALASWSARNDVDDYDAVIAAMERRNDALRQAIAANTEKARAQIGQALDKDAAVCGDLKSFLAADDYEIRPVVRSLRRLARNAGLDLEPAEQPTTAPAPIKLVGLAHFSVLAEAEMDQVGSRESALEDRHLRKTREERLEAYLKNQRVVAAFGRVVDDDALREWRGVQQSRFSLSCRSFRDKAQEAKMKAAIGKDMVVVGEPRSVIDGDNGRVTLRECLVFTLAETGQTVQKADDAAGLVHRPPEMAEVYAGAGKGIAAGDVDRVLYLAEFDNRMDGFGNGYTHRDETIYVLLDDGTAYRHEWSFPFTDLDVEKSREREPSRWFEWSKGWLGGVTLTKDGSEIDLTGAQELVSMPAETRLEHSYYFLNVGMGGSRRDRSFVFRADGTVTHTQGGFVAGNFATSYIMITGNRDKRATSPYRFEDFALVLSRPEGDERRFFATFKSADTADPEDVIIDGQVYWTRKPEAK